MPGTFWLVAVLALGAQVPGGPPRTEDVRVVEDFGDGLLLLSVGSRLEARQGEVLTVFRLRPAPAVVGDVRLTAVGDRYSLGRLVRRGADEPRVGDGVSLPRAYQPEPAGDKLRGGVTWDR